MTELLPLSPALHAASHSPSEFEVLCALSVTDPAAGQLEFIANLDLSTLQWPDLIRAAESHGVLPLVARNLVEHRRDLSGELLRELRVAYETNLKRNLRFAAELDRIAQHLQRSQLRAIPFKGVVLAESAYHDLGLRSFSDLDFLVSPADFIRAKGVLAEIGYRPPSEASPAVESLWLRVGYECAFDGSAGKIYSNCDGRPFRISMQSTFAPMICSPVPAGAPSLHAKCSTSLPKIYSLCFACMLRSIFGPASSGCRTSPRPSAPKLSTSLCSLRAPALQASFAWLPSASGWQGTCFNCSCPRPPSQSSPRIRRFPISAILLPSASRAARVTISSRPNISASY